MYLGIQFSVIRGSFAVRSYWQADRPTLLSNLVGEPARLVLVNPREMPRTTQVDYAFTFENTASDFLVENTFSCFSATPPGQTKFGFNYKLFECSTWDELIETLDKNLLDRAVWNERHKQVFLERKRAMEHYFFDPVPEVPELAEFYTNLYAVAGLDAFGGAKD